MVFPFTFTSFQLWCRRWLARRCQERGRGNSAAATLLVILIRGAGHPRTKALMAGDWRREMIVVCEVGGDVSGVSDVGRWGGSGAATVGKRQTGGEVRDGQRRREE